MKPPTDTIPLSKPTGGFTFLALPKELRLMVYERLSPNIKHYVFDNENESNHPKLRNKRMILVHSSKPTALLRTCRAIYEEAKPYIDKIDLGPPRMIVTPKATFELTYLIDRIRSILMNRSISRGDSVIDAFFFKTPITKRDPSDIRIPEFAMHHGFDVRAGFESSDPVAIKEEFNAWIAGAVHSLRAFEFMEVLLLRKKVEEAEDLEHAKSVLVRQGEMYGSRRRDGSFLGDINIFLEPVGAADRCHAEEAQEQSNRKTEILGGREFRLGRWVDIMVPLEVLGEEEWKAGWMEH